MKLNRNTQQKIVSASGAISLLVPWKVSCTCSSTNSTINSTKVWSLPGDAGGRAARRERRTAPTNSTAEHHREEHGVEIDDGEVDDAVRLPCSTGTSGDAGCIRSRPSALCSAAMLITELHPSSLRPASRARPPESAARVSSAIQYTRNVAANAGQHRQRRHPHHLQHHHEQHDHDGELDRLAEVERAAAPRGAIRRRRRRPVPPSPGSPPWRSLRPASADTAARRPASAHAHSAASTVTTA